MYIINIKTEERLECFVEEIQPRDFVMIQKNFSGAFNWKSESQKHQVYKLLTDQNEFIHGLISLIEREDYLELPLIENAKINLGVSKMYGRVAGNLIAYAASIALEKFDGFMLMKPKTKLIDHYAAAYGFAQMGGLQKMVSYPSNSQKLVTSYDV